MTTMASNVIRQETDLERRVADAVQEELSRRLTSPSTREQTAARLGLVPVGLDSLMGRYWTIEEAFRVAQALDLDFAGKLAQAERQAA